MQNLPPAEVYKKEFKFTPWGKLVHEVQHHVTALTPLGGNVLDLLCGPGYLLGKLEEARPDLHYLGVDLDDRYLQHAIDLYPGIFFEHGDAITWQTEEKFDAIICTAGVHHLPDDEQEPFIARLPSLLKKDGFVIIGDPYIGNFNSERERLIAGAELGHAFLVASISMGAPPDVIAAAVGVLSNDVLLVEWKTSIERRRKMLEPYFKHIEMKKTWPDHESEYGDYYFILK